MGKLFSFIISIVVILIIVFLALPFSMGLWAKNNYQRILNNINKSQNIVLKVVKFDRGWFTSEVTLQITIKGQWLRPKQDNAVATHTNPIQFFVRQHIKNGPWIFGVNKFLWAKALVQSVSNNANFKFRSQTIIHFNNTINNTFKANSITIANDQQQFVISTIKSYLSFNPKTQHFNSTMSIGSAHMAEKQNRVVSPQDYQQKFELQNLTFNSQLQHVKPIWYGNRSMTINKIYYNNKAKNKPIILTHVTLSSKQLRTGTTTTSSVAVHTDSIIGNDINLKPVDLKFSIAHVDTQSLASLINAAMKLRKIKQLNMEQIKTLYALVVLVSKGFTATLYQLNFGTPNGAVNATAQLKFPKQAGASSIFLLLRNANGQLHVQMPTAWLKQQLVNLYHGKTIKMQGKELSPDTVAQQQIQQWLTNKKLVQDGQNVKVDITFKNGQLLINGLPPSYQASVRAPTTKKQLSPKTTAQQ